MARATPAVVHIRTRTVQTSFFRQPFTVEGTGTGVIIEPNGTILTNNHVIEGARAIIVTMTDGRVFENVQVVGRDPLSDLAVLRVNARDLPTIPFADPAGLRVGQWVVAIGHALDLQGGPTVSVGVISALERAIDVPDPATGQITTLVDVIQTDAAINPGNSGGPLLNLQAELVGINTVVQRQAGAGVPVEGIGFAVSVSVIRPVAQALMTNGRVVYPFLGIANPVDVTPSVAAQEGLGDVRGVLIGDIVPNSPAARAGLRAGDVITALDGTQVRTYTQLVRALRLNYRPGQQVQVTFVRGGRQMNVTVTLGELPSVSLAPTRVQPYL